jgi:uncharacterized protein YbcC (UPF0753/DUF2309 family)
MAQAWAEKRIDAGHLDAALKELATDHNSGLTAAQCIDALEAPARFESLPLLIDLLDDDPARHTRLTWRQAITHQVSQTCAAYFDTHQADWHPERKQGLYAFWRDTLTHDHGIGMLMGLPQLGKSLAALPQTREEAQAWVLERLGLPESAWADYLESVLLTVNGWASWCAYLGWQAKLEGHSDDHLRDLLAIRLAWGVILLECKDASSAATAFAALHAGWARSAQCIAQAEQALLVDEVWQRALEIGYQHALAQQLSEPKDISALVNAKQTNASPAVDVQAVFCIDVRSEPMRRALEAVHPSIQTLGFAGFFGLPVAYTPLGTAARRPQLPGLLAPAIEATDQFIAQAPADMNAHQQAVQARQQQFATARPLQAASRWPGAVFSFVEVAGLAYLGKLGRSLWPKLRQPVDDDLYGLPPRYRSACRPVLSGLDTDAKVALAAKVLRAMGLAAGLAPVVLLVGHGSQSENNAQAAALDCGACCGQTGQVNARLLARLLNDTAVREGLRAQAIDIPDTTCFIAALHNTTTDEIQGLDLDTLPPHALALWQGVQPALAEAGQQVRHERAPCLGLDPGLKPAELLRCLQQRANDGAQTRPEWGLAGNAAFIIAPRHKTRGLVLNGRSFLHDYRPENDPDGSLLELLMTAPMLVTHWINWQYHASTCDPHRMGSGNKLLHNVVGGHIGVFEGNGGDLRIGLAHQSLHDGARFVHEPLRLTVVIDAPRDAIGRVMAQHRIVKDLVDNAWLHLWRFDAHRLECYANGNWVALHSTGSVLSTT